jgi:hypothetical protein
MKITVEVPEKDVEKLVREILENLPECCICLDCTKWNYAKCRFTIVDRLDDETSKKYQLTLKKAIAAFKTLACKWVLEGRYTYTDIMDSGYWDAPMVDSLVQVAVLGEERYA